VCAVLDGTYLASVVYDLFVVYAGAKMYLSHVRLVKKAFFLACV
jgi:hypothetical protein